METPEMWAQRPFITRLVSSSVCVSEAAGKIIKDVMAGGDLKIVNKSEDGVTSDPQTEADRRAQFCIVQSLQKHFSNLTIIGEEDITSHVPDIELGFSPDVVAVDSKISQTLKNIKEEEVVVWVDPLDGTSEVALAVKNKNAALLEQVTVLIGIAHQGRAIAGVIHQPYHGTEGRTIWAIEGCGTHGINLAGENKTKVVVTTRSHPTPSVLEALEALKKNGLVDTVEKVGGAGYKVLKVLEGSAAYVFASPGCKKWDTCAAEAILIAAGGNLTDISGRQIKYDATVQKQNSGGVLATSPHVQHHLYVNSIPETLKEALPEVTAKV